MVYSDFPDISNEARIVLFFSYVPSCSEMKFSDSQHRYKIYFFCPIRLQIIFPDSQHRYKIQFLSQILLRNDFFGYTTLLENILFEGEWREFPARDEPGARHNHSPNSDSSSGRQQTIYLRKIYFNLLRNLASYFALSQRKIK